MYVFYDEIGDGTVQFTANGADDLLTGRTDWIEVPFQDLGDLTAWKVLEGALVQTSLVPDRQRATDKINRTIGEIRAKYITDIVGQDALYMSKELEAKAYLADPAPEPNMALYPFLVGEIGITAPDAYQLSQVWLYMAAGWRSIAAPLEGVRMTAITAIGVAADQQALTDAEVAFTTTLSLLGA